VIVVTGGAGFIGRVVCERLEAEGVAVRGVDRQPGTTVTGDLLDLPLEEVLDGADGVIHLAGRGGVAESWSAGSSCVRDNVDATRRLLGALAPGIPLVLASSSSVYAPSERALREDAPCRPLSPYGLSKVQAEQLCGLWARERGTRWVGCRLFTVYGPGQRPDMFVARLLDAVATGALFELHAGAARHFTYVDDAVEGLLLALRRGVPGCSYNIAGPAAHPVSDVVTRLAELLGRSLMLRSAPLPAGLPLTTLADLELARTDLGFAPRIGLAKGLARQLRAAETAARCPA